MIAETWADLEEAMKQGHIVSLEKTRQYLATRWAFTTSVSMVSGGTYTSAHQAKNWSIPAPLHRSRTAGGVQKTSASK